MILGIGLTHRVNNFGYVPDPRTEGCADAERDETLCERCKNYDPNGSCCYGNEFMEVEDGECNGSESAR